MTHVGGACLNHSYACHTKRRLLSLTLFVACLTCLLLHIRTQALETSLDVNAELRTSNILLIGLNDDVSGQLELLEEEHEKLMVRFCSCAVGAAPSTGILSCILCMRCVSC